MTMRNVLKSMLMAGAALAFAGLGFADTLELKDGRVLQGKYLGGTQSVLRFEVNGDVQTFPTNDIVALTFTRSSGYPQQPAPRPTSVDPGPPPQAPSAPQSQNTQQYNT